MLKETRWDDSSMQFEYFLFGLFIAACLSVCVRASVHVGWKVVKHLSYSLACLCVWNNSLLFMKFLFQLAMKLDWIAFKWFCSLLYLQQASKLLRTLQFIWIHSALLLLRCRLFLCIWYNLFDFLWMGLFSSSLSLSFYS